MSKPFGQEPQLFLNDREVCRIVFIPKGDSSRLKAHTARLTALREQGKIDRWVVNDIPGTHVCVEAIMPQG